MIIQDFVQAIREDRDAWVTGESASESLKIVDGFHGRKFEGIFKGWILVNYAVPNLIEDAMNKDLEDLKGLGQLIKDLIEIVMSEGRLKYPSHEPGFKLLNVPHHVRIINHRLRIPRLINPIV